MNPIISIVIPCYNVEEYIDKCLNSILNQSYKNIELICINDGSTDKTLSIIEQFADRDSRIKLHNQANKGLSKTRSLGLKYASGDYIMFVDADDWLSTDCIETVLTPQKNYDVICFSYIREFANQSVPKILGLAGEYTASDLQRRMVGPVDNEISNIENLDALVTVWGKLYRSEKVKHVKFTEVATIGTWEDGLFNLNVLENCQNVLILDQPLYHYRKTNQNSFTSLYKKDFYKKWMFKFSLISELIVGKDEVYKKALKNRIAISVLGLTLTEINNKNSISKKINGIKYILSEKIYHNALVDLDKSAMPIHWKIFYTFARHKRSLEVFLLANAILLLINRKN